jgi:hypothetical protein
LFGGGHHHHAVIPRKLRHHWHIIWSQYSGLSGDLVITNLSDTLRAPDFYTLEVNVGGLFGASADLSVDRYGHRYVGIGTEIGKSATLVSASVTGGWLNQKKTPNSKQLHDFLTGNSFNAGGGFILGAEESSTPGVGTATQAGAFSPQLGIAYHYGFELP